MQTHSRRIREPIPIGDGACEMVLTRGYVGLIDESDAERVEAYSWYASLSAKGRSPYASAWLPCLGKAVSMHRLLLCFPLLHVDHANGNTLDNRRCNLRLARNGQNIANSQRRSDSPTAFKGVQKHHKRYRASVASARIGSFSTPLEAALAYDKAAIERWGEFAKTNASLGLLPQEVTP